MDRVNEVTAPSAAMEKAVAGQERIISMVDMFGSVQPPTDLCMYESQGEVSMSSRVMVRVMVRARIELEDFRVTVVGTGMIG